MQDVDNLVGFFQTNFFLSEANWVDSLLAELLQSVVKNFLEVREKLKDQA